MRILSANILAYSWVIKGFYPLIVTDPYLLLSLHTAPLRRKDEAKAKRRFNMQAILIFFYKDSNQLNPSSGNFFHWHSPPQKGVGLSLQSFAPAKGYPLKFCGKKARLW
jgi:hypothetical protein